jgi:hypothetical protein
LLTTDSFDFDRPGAAPWAYNLAANNPNQYPLVALDADPSQAPLGSALPFPDWRWRNAPPSGFTTLGGDFTPGDWRAGRSRLPRIDLNRPLTPYPPTVGVTDGRFDGDLASARQFLQAQGDRQRLADDIYRRLLAATGLPAPVVPSAPTDEELRPRRWLAQLAANVVDFIDEDDVSTPFNFYTSADASNDPAFDVGTLSASDLELPRYWVFGTELPRVVLNEVLAEFQEQGPGAPYYNRVWVELHNPLPVSPSGQNLQRQDGSPVALHVNPPSSGSSYSTSGDARAYAPYRVVLANRLAARPDNDNVLGKPDQVRAAMLVDDFAAAAPIGGGPSSVATLAPQGFFLLGPPGNDVQGSISAPTVPAATPIVRSGRLQYPVTFTTPADRTPEDGPTGIAVLLRRLANPYAPFDPRPAVAGQPNPWYNPYVTVDYLDGIPLHDASQPGYASRGKRQPYASFLKTTRGGNFNTPARDSPVTDQIGPGLTRHSFGLPNNPPPRSGHYDWLVHLDRQLVSPMELLQVSGYQPHQLTHQFMRGSTAAKRFNHLVPWFDQTRRLYRVFEFLETRASPLGPSPDGRIPGKVNLNTIWDHETLLALCDAREPDDAGNPSYFTRADVYNPQNLADPETIYGRLLARRSPGLLAGGQLGAEDRPFRGLAAGYVAEGDSQYPTGLGIEDTLLRSFSGESRRLFQLPAARVPDRHPYLQDQLLTKLFNNLTTRSNVFAVWLTVGFFEVTDATSRPVKLGPEVGRAEGRHVRHRAFAVVDRSLLTKNPGPQQRFNMRAAQAPGGAGDQPVLFFSIID